MESLSALAKVQETPIAKITAHNANEIAIGLLFLSNS